MIKCWSSILQHSYLEIWVVALLATTVTFLLCLDYTFAALFLQVSPEP